MKNYLNYFYDFSVDKLVYTNKKYIFNVDEDTYIFKECSDFNLINYYGELSKVLFNFKFFSKFILNNKGQLLTFIDNKYYILLKINKSTKIFEKIRISDIRNDMFVYDIENLHELKKFPWIELWELKIDYLEKWLLDKKDLYKNVYPIFNYFIGLSENALLYLKESLSSISNVESTCLSVQHFRISYDTVFYEYYDPTNIIFDHPCRDMCEYFKSMFKNKIFDFELFENYVNSLNVSKSWIMIMYSRILFPSFFFDLFDESVEEDNISDLLNLEDIIGDFQFFLNKISSFLYKKYKIEVLKWL